MKGQTHLKNLLKLPNYLDLGTILPGQYGQSYLVFTHTSPLFLSLSLNPKAIQNGFFLLLQGANQSYQTLNIIVKPNKSKKVIIESFCQEVSESRQFQGDLIITENQMMHKIKLGYRVQIPRIKCLKMMKDISNNFNLLKLLVNKAVTNDIRISLFNQESYSLTFQAGLMKKVPISDKSSPYILKTHPGNIKADPKAPFMLFLNIQTNIGFGSDLKGLKNVVLRNVLVLKTNSVIIWCLPIELTIIFVKQPQIKE